MSETNIWSSLSGIALSYPMFVLLICLVSLLLFFLLVFRHHRLQHIEFGALKQVIRAISRGQPIPSRLNLKTRGAREVFNSLLSLSSRERDKQGGAPSLDDLVALGSRISSAADEIERTAEAVVALLREKIGSHVVAIAIVLKEMDTGELKIQAADGVPTGRIDDTLLMHFDRLFDDAQQTADEWGYWSDNHESLQDYSTFGISQTLTIPLRNAEGVCGGLWLGFRYETSLTPQRKTFVHAIASHAAASFNAAQRSHARRQQSVQERDFLMGISHDLRAPGSSALFALRDLLSGELGTLTQEQHEHLSIIEQSLESQFDLLGDVFDYVKHQRGLLEAHPQLVSLRELLQHCIAPFRLSAERVGLELICSQIPDTSASIDPRHLKRILANLLSNAIKYTERGQIFIDCREVDDEIEITVADTGSGVPAAAREKLFVEFTRLDNSDRTASVGLGLALAKALAQLNGADVFYQPRAGGGSIFGIRIRKQQNGIATNWNYNSAAIMLETVLVVDDDPAACRMYIRYLNGMAEKLVPCSSCEEAIEIARALKPSLIITDYHLGNDRAESLLNILQEDDLQCPVLVITGSSDRAALVQLESAYNAVVLEKPTNRETLRQTVQRMFLVALPESKSERRAA